MGGFLAPERLIAASFALEYLININVYDNVY
jgi:hypothetical protein